MHLYVIAANSYSSFYVSVYVFCTKLGAFLLFFFIYKSFVWCAAAKWTRIKAATLPVFKALMPLDFDKKHYYCLRILNKTILMTYFFFSLKSSIKYVAPPSWIYRNMKSILNFFSLINVRKQFLFGQ